MNMMKASQTRTGLINTLTRRKLLGKGNSPTVPKPVVVLAAGARKNVTKPNQSATTAFAATLNVQAMPTRSHGPRMVPRKLLQRCRQKSVCPRLRYLPITQGVASAIRCTFHTASPTRSHIQNRAFRMEAMVLEVDRLVWTNRSASHRKLQRAHKLKSH